MGIYMLKLSTSNNPFPLSLVSCGSLTYHFEFREKIIALIITLSILVETFYVAVCVISKPRWYSYIHIISDLHYTICKKSLVFT